MSFIVDFTEGLNKSVMNGINIGRKAINNALDSVESTVQKGLSRGVKDSNSALDKISSPTKSLIKNIDSDINKGIDTVVKYYNKDRDAKLGKKIDKVVKKYSSGINKLEKKTSSSARRAARRYSSEINKLERKTSSSANRAVRKYSSEINKLERSVSKKTNSFVKTYNREINKIEKRIKKAKIPGSKLGEKVIKTTDRTIKKYDSAIVVFYKSLHRYLIKPLDKESTFDTRFMSFSYLIITFILLLLTTVNSMIVDNTIGRVISAGEKIVGYKSDGRRVGKAVKKKPSQKFPLLMKIVRSILMIFATLFDLILMAFTNQVDVFANLVKDLLKKA